MKCKGHGVYRNVIHLFLMAGQRVRVQEWEDLGLLISYMDATENDKNWLIIFKKGESKDKLKDFIMNL